LIEVNGDRLCLFYLISFHFVAHVRAP